MENDSKDMLIEQLQAQLKQAAERAPGVGVYNSDEQTSGKFCQTRGKSI